VREDSDGGGKDVSLDDVGMAIRGSAASGVTGAVGRPKLNGSWSASCLDFVTNELTWDLQPVEY